jgi:hypothetical protein
VTIYVGAIKRWYNTCKISGKLTFLLHVYLYCIVLAWVLCLSDCLNTSGVCNLIFIINWIVCDKKYNNVYKHKHIHSLIIRNTQNDFDFVFNR